jgi:hypothetical protein
MSRYVGVITVQEPESCKKCGGPVPCAAHTCKVCGRDDGSHFTTPHVLPGELIRVNADAPWERPAYIFKIGPYH